MSKILRSLKHTLELIWLFVSIASLGIGIFENLNEGFRSALPFYIFCALALFFYTSRRKERLQK